MSTEYRPAASRVLAAVIGVVCAIGLGALTIDQGIGGLARHGSWIVLPAVICWALFWNPRVDVDEAGVVLVNVLRTIRLPWPAIRAVDTKWALNLDTAYGRFTAWAAPGPGRHANRDISSLEIEHLPESSRGDGGGLRPGDSPRSSSGLAAIAVRRQWEALRDAGHLDNPRLEFERPPVMWHVGMMGAVAALLALGVAGLVL